MDMGDGRPEEKAIADLDMETVRSGLKDGSLLLVDVRETHEFAIGHIPGSVSLPLSQFDPAELPLQSGKRIVFSCAAGVRSLKALHMARSAGFNLNEHFAAGFRGWLVGGGEVSDV